MVNVSSRVSHLFDISTYQLGLIDLCIDVCILRCLGHLKSDLNHRSRKVSHRDELPERSLHDGLKLSLTGTCSCDTSQYEDLILSVTRHVTHLLRQRRDEQ